MCVYCVYSVHSTHSKKVKSQEKTHTLKKSIVPHEIEAIVDVGYVWGEREKRK